MAHPIEGSPAEERGESKLVEKTEVRTHIDASNARHTHVKHGHGGTRHTGPSAPNGPQPK